MRPRPGLLFSASVSAAMPRPIAFVLLLLCLAALPGCDALAPDRSVTVTGRVVDAADGRPLPGVAVILYRRGPIIVPYEDVRTGADGRFELFYRGNDNPNLYAVGVNSERFGDPSLSAFEDDVLPGTTTDLGDIELERRTTPGPMAP